MKQKLYDFLKEIDDDFPTPLSEKVKIEDYVDKIIAKSHIILRKRDSEIVGALFFYCNDEVTKTAYCSLLGVSKKYRKQGLATSLVIEMIDLVKKAGFKKIHVFTDNPKALAIYEKLGFKVIERLSEIRVKLEYQV